VASLTAALAFNLLHGVAQAQNNATGWQAAASLAALEDELLTQINALRTDPQGFADRVMAPLQAGMVRTPRDPKLPFRGFAVHFPGGSELDYVWLDEGIDERTARAVLDEALAALRRATPVAALERNSTLDRAARYFARDFVKGGMQRPPHVDSSGRGVGARLASFGSTAESQERWDALVRKTDDQDVEIQVFERSNRFLPLLHSTQWPMVVLVDNRRFWRLG